MQEYKFIFKSVVVQSSRSSALRTKILKHCDVKSKLCIHALKKINTETYHLLKIVLYIDYKLFCDYSSHCHNSDSIQNNIAKLLLSRNNMIRIEKVIKQKYMKYIWSYAGLEEG